MHGTHISTVCVAPKCTYNQNVVGTSEDCSSRHPTGQGTAGTASYL